MKFFTESWHSRLATFYGPLHRGYSDREVDFCKYFWGAVKGFFAVMGILAASALVSFPVGDMIAWLTFMIVNHTLIAPDVPATFLLIFITISIVGSIVIWGCQVVAKILKEKVGRKILLSSPDDKNTFSFLATWMYTIKNKVCVPVVIPGNKHQEY